MIHNPNESEFNGLALNGVEKSLIKLLGVHVGSSFSTLSHEN